MRVARAMTVAGSDSGGGAGIQADLKVFTSLGVYGMSAVTAVTSQNTLGVTRIDALPPEAVVAQMEACLDDIGVDAAKTGMLHSAAIVEAVADVFRRYRVKNLVVDPVMVAKSGDVLLEPGARERLRKCLLPLARVATPNLHEARDITGGPVDGFEGMKDAARQIADLGVEVVVVKGGHLGGSPLDVVFDGQAFHTLPGERLPTRNTHGTGCTFSAAITGGLAEGLEVREAIERAKELVTWGIANGLPIGGGYRPTNHFYFQMPPGPTGGRVSRQGQRHVEE